ncbi:hypothetical protein NMY22_g8135 [Coprinellus aureogranulatus]|nr:hypothetical protein NMY22_g8135 [Coprinellus aureogranulatus]
MPFSEYVDPLGHLTTLMGSDFVHSIDNEVTYMEAVKEGEITKYRAVSPTAFKVGDIVKAVVALLCFPVGKDGKVKMSIALRGLSLIDRSERDKAAILRMKSRHMSRLSQNGSELKRKSAYEDEDEDEDQLGTRTSQEGAIVTKFALDIIFQVMDQIEDLQDLAHLSQTNWHFHIAQILWAKSNSEKMVARNGIQNTQNLMAALDQTNSIVTGPECLAIWYPNIPTYGRLEIFTPHPGGSKVPPIVTYLVKKEQFKIDARPFITRPEDLYQETEFGRTVSQIITLTKRPTKKNAAEGICVVVVSHSPDTAMVTMAEMPSTLFMNCITGTSVVCLYPDYTFKRVGLMNYDGPVCATIMKTTKPFIPLGFTFVTKLSEPYASAHICGYDHKCPYTIQNSMSGKTSWTNIHQPYSTDTKDVKMANRFIVWRLRCAGMCGDKVPEADIMEALTILYITLNYQYVGH